MATANASDVPPEDDGWNAKCPAVCFDRQRAWARPPTGGFDRRSAARVTPMARRPLPVLSAVVPEPKGASVLADTRRAEQPEPAANTSDDPISTTKAREYLDDPTIVAV